jgi:tRNA dimethylallyltransferase
MVVGGSGLYIQSFLTGLSTSEAPSSHNSGMSGKEFDGVSSSELLLQCDENELYEKLQEVDPDSAARISPNDTYRIRRALEYYTTTRKRISEDRPGLLKLEERVLALKLFLHRARGELYRRINERVDRMVEEGLFDEVREILSNGFTPQMQSMRTVGYTEVCQYLTGDLSRDETIALIKKNTRNYAKRQLTWFKRLHSWLWVSLDQRTIEDVTREIEVRWRKWEEDQKEV